MKRCFHLGFAISLANAMLAYTFTMQWVLALALLLAVPAGSAEPEVELLGSWHVLVHYKDDNASNPERERWEDKIWVFSKAGSRLRWTEYPIVVFADHTGRFERLGTSRAARLLGYWEPNDRQRAQIASGLEVNPRGSKSKTLRGSVEEGWRSTQKANAPSVSVITYVEHWSVEGLPDRPVFTREDQLGSQRTETLEGVTRYTTREVSGDGNSLLGEFERDGTRRGSFRMTRSGESRDVKDSGKSYYERIVEEYQRRAVPE